MADDDLDQRTHAPTQKRIDDFRKRGEVALSKDLSSVGTLAGGVIALLFYAHAAQVQLSQFMTRELSTLTRPSLAEITALMSSCIMPPAIGAGFGYLLTVAVQIGWPPVLKPPTLDFPKLFSFGALIQLVSPQAMAGRTFKSIAKLAFVGAAATSALIAAHHEFMTSPVLDARGLGVRLLALASRLFLTAGGALLLLGVGDFLWTKRQYNRRLKMTPAEMKREHREQEGDPQIKRKRRQRMRELARRRLTAAVKTADVVIVNPTEYAVALRYRSAEDRAPRVVAKGRGPVAERIRELARSSGIPIIPEPPLARLLHKVVPEGREIPSTLFNAVAEVLAYVYRLRGRPR